MDDQHIVELYFRRDEQAIAHTQKQYGNYCHAIANNILGSREDAEECVNDTYLRAWDSIPPQRPQSLAAYLAKITRNLAITRWRTEHREKRGGGQTVLALEELRECIPDSNAADGDALTESVLLRDALNTFLRTLPEPSRGIFLRRYWYVCSITEIAAEFGMTESRVKMLLLRTRDRLRKHLEQEGIRI